MKKPKTEGKVLPLLFCIFTLHKDTTAKGWNTMLFLTVSVGKKYPARNSAVTAQVNTADSFFIQTRQAQFFNYKNYANVSYMVGTRKTGPWASSVVGLLLGCTVFK